MVRVQSRMPPRVEAQQHRRLPQPPEAPPGGRTHRGSEKKRKEGAGSSHVRNSRAALIRQRRSRNSRKLLPTQQLPPRRHGRLRRLSWLHHACPPYLKTSLSTHHRFLYLYEPPPPLHLSRDSPPPSSRLILFLRDLVYTRLCSRLFRRSLFHPHPLPPPPQFLYIS